jgi:hypothetical protein
MAMRESDQINALLIAVERGYTVDEQGIAHNRNGGIVNGCTCTTGYRYITIRMDAYYGRRKCCKVPIHRLMAYQKFSDKIFDESLEVRHLNNDKLDNSWNNIAIGTSSQNRYDMDEEERLRIGRLAARTLRKFTDKEIKEIRLRHKNGDNYDKILEDYDMAKSTLSYIINRVTYNDIAI